MIYRRSLSCAALALLACMPGLAHAEQAQAKPAAKNPKHDSNAPIDWTADRIEVHDQEHYANLTGNVRAVQGEMTLTADRAVANYSGSAVNSDEGSAQIHRLDATGHVVVTRPSQVAHGNYGIYDLDKRLITMIGNVTLDRTGPNPSTVRGGRLVINLNTNQATVDGSAVGGAGSAGTGGRVSGRFTVPPKKNDSDDKPASPSAKAAGK